MNIYSIKPAFQKFLNPLARVLAKKKIHPTNINVWALIVSITGGLALFYAEQNLFLLLYIPVMAFARTALNALDGMIARINKVKHQDYGEVLNELTDRLSDMAIFLGLALTPYTNQTLGMLSVTSILLVSYMGILPKAANAKRQYSGPLGKADRMFYLSIGAILMFIFPATPIMNYFLIFIILGSALTIVNRFIKSKNELKK
jgi:CDP-diacylglycerol--glycerol-3-phosphate 3-phosphatidyltransferase|tara:strand:+ start:2632 stop:3237 length:606 start_codon:yes stop_codon:yes gene_type:complete